MRPLSLPVIAHELTHCAQYQSWGPLRYYARGAAERLRELRWRLGLGPSPYAYELEPEKPFDRYRMEQQGQIVEDCFRGSRAPRPSRRIDRHEQLFTGRHGEHGEQQLFCCGLVSEDPKS